MKRFWTILYTWCLLLLLGCGAVLLFTAPREETYSESENRLLEPFSPLTASSVLSGEFSASFERYMLDRFPLRDVWIALSGDVGSRLSLLSAADEVKLAALDTPIDETGTELSEAASDLPGSAPAPSPKSDDGSGAAALPEVASGMTIVTHTPSQAMARAPLTDYNKDKDLERADTVDVKLIRTDGSETVINQYKKFYIRHAASLFNRLLKLLPEDGHVYVALAQRGEHVIQYTAALDKYTAYVSEAEDYLEPLLDERITVFRTMDILEPFIRAGEYVYFMTDHHWTVRGAYYVHKAMMEAQGRLAVPLEDSRIQRQSGSYRGLNYKKAARLLPKGARDYVEMVEPSIPYAFYRVTNITNLKEYTLNDPKHKGYQAVLWLNMKPWKMIRTYENTGRKMLLICDSMGMAFAPFMAYYYDEVHIVRPHETYYSTKMAGGTIKQYIDHYGIDDIYVVQSNFFTWDLYRDTLDRSIGD